MTPKALKKWQWIHKWTSLVCTVFALLLCLTGLPLIFTEEINEALGYGFRPPVHVDGFVPGSAARIDDIVADARRRRPGQSVLFLSHSDDEKDLYYISLAEKADAIEATTIFAYDGRNAGLLGEYPLNQGVMSVILRLHVDLFAGLPGTLFLGAMGVVLVLSILSGVVLYGPYMRKLLFGVIRRRSLRLLWLDVHNLIGIVTLGWFTLVSVTGVVNTLSGPIFGRWQATHLTEMLAPYANAEAAPLAPGPGAQRALETALAHVPASDLGFMAFPGNRLAGPRQYCAFLRGNTPLREKLLKPVLLDAQEGRVLDERELPGYVTALLVSQPLHFGDYGGLPLKVVWFVLDVLSIVLLGSGLYLWLVKRKGTPA